jgi:hypothetical protein
VEASLRRLFDHLSIDQVWMGLLDRWLGASWLARAWKGLQRVERSAAYGRPRSAP